MSSACAASVACVMANEAQQCTCTYVCAGSVVEAAGMLRRVLRQSNLQITPNQGHHKRLENESI